MNVPWQDISVGVAAIIGLIYVARTMRVSQKELLDFLYNHLSENTKAQVANTRALTKLADAVERAADESRDFHREGEQR